jgi:glutamine synthetase
MDPERIAFVGVSDLSGHFRGKSFPLADLAQRLERGVGLAPSNIMMSAFGPIHETPYGTAGEVLLIPDPATRVEVDFDEGPPELFFCGDIVTLEGAAWGGCPRGFLQRGLAALEKDAGLRLLSAFEQELVYTGVEGTALPYTLDALRRQGRFGETLLAALRQAGITPDSFLAEYAPRQYEVTVKPAIGVAAADHAVAVRELARAVAFRLGHRAIFAPILAPDGVGNGTHIHFSLLDTAGEPAMPDPVRPHGLSKLGEHFVAGVLKHLPTLTAVTAPSVASYYRLRPGRWAPTDVSLATVDRGAGLRICPLIGDDAVSRRRQFNVEYRVADAAASPHLALGALVHAGLDGIRKAMTLPAPDEATDAERLPATLTEALDRLAASPDARAWFGDVLFDLYLSLKRAEVRALQNLDEAEICRRYADVY